MTTNTDQVAASGHAARTRVTKMDRPPYTATGDIDALFERMSGLAAPQKVDGAWAKAYKLKEETIIVLKWLGVASADGTVDKEGWAKIRLPSTRQATLAELVQKSYAPIFEQIDSAKAGKDDIHGALVTKYGMADTARYIRAFIKLCGLAGIELGGLSEAETDGDTKPTRQPRAPRPVKQASARPEGGKREAPQRKPPVLQEVASQRVALSLNVEIPANWTEEQIKERLATVKRAIGEPEG